MNNSEIELLQLAASAANINVKFDFYESAFVDDDKKHWNPLYCSGDAFRLAVALLMIITINERNVSAFIQGTNNTITESVKHDNIEHTLRVAIVKAAADLERGRTK